MSYAAFIDSAKARLEGLGLSFMAEGRLSSAQNLGRGKFDGCFSITSESLAEPWPELTNNPTQFRNTIRVEVGTEIKTSEYEADKLLTTRAESVYRALLYPNPKLTDGVFYGLNTQPRKERVGNDKRLVWVIILKARYDAT